MTPASIKKYEVFSETNLICDFTLTNITSKLSFYFQVVFAFVRSN